MIALLYEIFPLDHFHILLPIAAILIALMADWSRYNSPSTVDHGHAHAHPHDRPHGHVHAHDAATSPTVTAEEKADA
jgi:hypothetical protein